MYSKKNKLVFLGLNEIYFPIVRKYAKANKKKFPNLLKITNNENYLSLECDNKYELLEPWIQWPSIFNGKKGEEHKIFRLGDVINKNYEQIFEKIEKRGFSVGAISPMNASNELKDADFFIPDPWTDTPSDGAKISQLLSRALSQSVNDNSSGRITPYSFFILIYAFILHVRFKSYYFLFKLALSSINKPWRRALFLDMFLNEIFISLKKKRKTEFTFLFLNAGAHIQHHYFHNSPYINDTLINPEWYIKNYIDPLEELLVAYEKILSDHLENKNQEIVIATGLTQSPTKKIIFYYRIRNHHDFLKEIGVEFIKVLPRMSRDFLVTFASEEEKETCLGILKKSKINNQEVFEIVVREKELFVTLSYPDEIKKQDILCINEQKRVVSKDVVFVALKNGEHLNKSFVYLSKGIIGSKDIKQGDNVASLHYVLDNYFHSEE